MILNLEAFDLFDVVDAGIALGYTLAELFLMLLVSDAELVILTFKLLNMLRQLLIS